MMHDQPSSPPPPGQRVSVLVGDRLCTHCGYNLTGQAVLREPHYNLLIVRCPECAAVASVQEYPLLGRWANRWAAMLAGLWMLVLLAMWVGSGAAIFGLCVGTAEWASEDYRAKVFSGFQQWQTSAQGSAGAAATFTVNDFEAWWKQQNQQSFGGWAHIVEWRALLLWIPLTVVAMGLGCFWAVALLTKRRAWLLLWGGAVMLVACAFSSVVIAEWFNDERMQWYAAGAREVGFPIVLMSLTFAALALSIGLLIGRSVVRGLVRALLPPRLRSSLALLWTAEGLSAPSAR